MPREHKERQVTSSSPVHSPHRPGVYVFNRATPFHSSTCVAHASDLTVIFDEVPLARKAVVALLVDGGPDLNPAHVTNFLSYGRLWRDQQLDCLIIATHAPGQSAYNYIEHSWSVLSRSLTGVTLPNHLPDEQPPCEQHLPEEDRRRKESVVFDQAIDMLCGHWHHRKYDNHEIVPRKVNCLEPHVAEVHRSRSSPSVFDGIYQTDFRECGTQ